MWLLYVFIASLFLALVLFLLKLGELKKGKKNPIGRLLSRGDASLVRLGKYFEGHFHYRREKTFFFFLVHLPNRFESFFARLRTKTHDRYLDLSARIRGKRNLSKNTASPYMRSMTTDREDSNSV